MEIVPSRYNSYKTNETREISNFTWLLVLLSVDEECGVVYKTLSTYHLRHKTLTNAKPQSVDNSLTGSLLRTQRITTNVLHYLIY